MIKYYAVIVEEVMHYHVMILLKPPTSTNNPKPYLLFGYVGQHSALKSNGPAGLPWAGGTSNVFTPSAVATTVALRRPPQVKRQRWSQLFVTTPP